MINNNGVDLEKNYPYNNFDKNCNKNIIGDKYNLIDYKNIEDEDMFSFLLLLREQPVTLAINATDLFMFYENGIFDVDDGNDVNHAVLAVGYFIDESNPEDSYIKIKNSWGEEWGENGYVRIKLFNKEKTEGMLKILYYGSEVLAPVVE